MRVEKGKQASWAGIVDVYVGQEWVRNPIVTGLEFSELPEVGWNMRFRVFNQMGSLGQVPLGWLYGLTFRIDPTTTPKVIDVFAVNDKQLVAVGIYDVSGGRLKLALAKYTSALKTEQRPRSFEIEPTSADILFDFERYQPPQDEKALLGEWQPVSQLVDGKPVPDETLRRKYYQCEGDRFNVWPKDKRTAEAEGVQWMTYSLDVSKRPKWITFYKIDDQAEKPTCQVLPGIYNLAGDRLTIAYRKGDPRPETFESKPGSGITLLALRRSEPPKPTVPSGAGGTHGVMGGGMGRP